MDLFDDDDGLLDLDVDALVAAHRSSQGTASQGSGGAASQGVASQGGASQDPASQGGAAIAAPLDEDDSTPPLLLPPPQRTLGAWVATSSSTKPVEKTLFDCFGYDEFREGQREVVEAALAGRDVSVFWATGRGKSLCYQIPALHTGRTAIVVSPLISLMADQVERLNNSVGRGERQVAAFLGSAQLDPTVESRAFAGAFPLVYMSPEKLMAGGTLSRLVELHSRKPLLLFAIDEAHCVSEWGHDFRREFRMLGQLRERLPSVPLLALTATAVPEVQQDILRSLGMRDPLIMRSSSYRSNLNLRLTRKTGGGISADLSGVLAALKPTVGGGLPSTLVYVPTRGDAEKVSAFLKSRGVHADYYHGSRTPHERERVHLSFLSGALPVVVATVAFGMGIDKPDIRQVVHYGAPKTAEEYYQHIGRAGRDGGPSVCHMISSDADFARYASDFYTKDLPAPAKARQLASTERLRAFANDVHGCRWVALLQLMGESAAFARCGTCDTCSAAREHAGDTERDFGPETRVLLTAVQQHSGAWTHIQKALDAGAGPLATLRAALRPRRSTQTLRDFMPVLEQAGLVARSVQKGTYGAYDVLRISPKGATQLGALSRVPPPPLQLAVPAALRAAEDVEKAKAAKTRAEVTKVREKLLKAGYELAAVPEAELEPGAERTPVTNALLHWARTLDDWTRRGMGSRADAHRALHVSLLGWRQEEAQRLRMAPASVLADHLALKLCLVKPADPDSLQALGARVTADGAAAVVALIRRWKEQHAADASASQEGSGAAADGAMGGGGSSCAAAPMVLPAGTYAPRPWALAVPPAGKKPPAWEASWARFQERGESIERIALTQESGKSVQPSTVLGHLMTALTQGRRLDLARLGQQGAAQQLGTPSSAEWEQLRDAEAAAAVDVAKQEKVNQTELLKTFLPQAEKEFAERTEADKAVLYGWFSKVGWYMALRRVGLQPSFDDAAGSEAKRPRLA